MKSVLLLAMVFLGSITLYAQDVQKSTYHYATHQGQELLLDRYMIEDETNESRPCMIFAFGGGFVSGSRDVDFYMGYFERLAREGIVVVSIDYRLGLSNLQPDGGIVAMIGAFDNAVTIAVEDINDNNIISTINMRSKSYFVFSSKDMSCFSSNST